MEYLVVFWLVAFVGWMVQMDLRIPPRPVDAQRRIRNIAIAEVAVFSLVLMSGFRTEGFNGLPLVLVILNAVASALLRPETSAPMSVRERAEASQLAKQVLESQKSRELPPAPAPLPR